MADEPIIDMWEMGNDGMLSHLTGTERLGAATGPGMGDVFPASLLFCMDATGRFFARGGGVNGAGLIDVTYGAAGNSTTALRATLNNGNGGAYVSGYSAEANFGHNSEFVAASGWMARHTDAARYTQSGGAHSWYGNVGLTAGAAFTPSLRMRLDEAGRLMLGGAAANYLFNAAASNPGRGILADFANVAGSGLNGALISFTQNGIANMCFGMAPGAPNFSWYVNRNGGADGTEIMRLTSGGELGVGVPPAVKFHAKSTDEIARFETTVVRGSGNAFLSIHDPSGRKGYVGYGGSNDTLYLMNELGGIIFGTSGANRWVINSNGFIPDSDNTYDFGGPSNRLKTMYAVTGTINTCDIRFKTFRADPAPSAAELRAALRIVDQLGFHQFNDAVELKGPEGARWHFGPRAQQAWSICAEEGLCLALFQRETSGDWLPSESSIPPAFLCFDEWVEETAPVMEDVEIPAVLNDEGTEIEPARIEQRPTGETYVTREAGNRFGVRIDQLHSLMIAALNAERLKQEAVAVAQAGMIASMEARLAALEAAA